MRYPTEEDPIVDGLNKIRSLRLLEEDGHQDHSNERRMIADELIPKIFALYLKITGTHQRTAAYYLILC